MDIIDLRSDTVTQPTKSMRAAMSTAEVGDDVYGEDPSINRLQDLAAEITGKEAAIFVPSGTMGNLSAVLTHCNRGDEIILGNLAHTFLYEAGGIAALGGVHPHTLPNQPDGTIDLDAIKSAINNDDPHFAPTKLIALESTHNRCGGVTLSAEYIQQVKQIADENDLKLHLDGARVFNATVTLAVTPKDYLAAFDSVTFCLSKGLCAPVGSLLCGSEVFIQRAHRMRKQLGGGMRQAGILAMAGIVAIEEMIDRLIEDHKRAASLASQLDEMPGIRIFANNSNMVYMELADNIDQSDQELLDYLGENHIKIGQVGQRQFRMVTHYWIDDQAVATVIAVFKKFLES